MDAEVDLGSECNATIAIVATIVLDLINCPIHSNALKFDWLARNKQNHIMAHSVREQNKVNAFDTAWKWKYFVI